MILEKNIDIVGERAVLPMALGSFGHWNAKRLP